MDALPATGIRARPAAVPRVFGAGGWPQVGSPVVQSVAIAVVDLRPAGDERVHSGVSAVDQAHRIKGAAAPLSAPGPSGDDGVEVVGVDDRDLPLGQGDLPRSVGALA